MRVKGPCESAVFTRVYLCVNNFFFWVRLLCKSSGYSEDMSKILCDLPPKNV